MKKGKRASMGTGIVVCMFISANVVLRTDPFPNLLAKST